MAQLSVTFDGVTKEKTAPDSWLPILAKFLAARNVEREAEGLAPHDSLAAYFVEILATAAKSYKAQQEEIDHSDRREAYDAADASTQAQVDALLEPFMED